MATRIFAKLPLSQRLASTLVYRVAKMAPKRAAFTGLLTGLTLALQAGSAFDSVILVLISVVCAYMTAMIAK